MESIPSCGKNVSSGTRAELFCGAPPPGKWTWWTSLLWTDGRRSRMPGTLLSPTDLGVPQGSPARGPLAGSPKWCWTNICSLLFCYFVHHIRTNNKITLNKWAIPWFHDGNQLFVQHWFVFCSGMTVQITNPECDFCYFVICSTAWTNTDSRICYLLFCSNASNKFIPYFCSGINITNNK